MAALHLAFKNMKGTWFKHLPYPAVRCFIPANHVVYSNSFIAVLYQIKTAPFKTLDL